MKKLEEIEKKHPFSTPEGYFHDLPTRIQARIAAPKKLPAPVFVWTLKYALPALVMLFISYWVFFKTEPNLSSDQILAQVNTEDIIEYLASTEISTDEIMDELGSDGFYLDLFETDGEVLDELDIGDSELEEIIDLL